MARESIPTITPFPSPPSFYRGPKEERREETGRRNGIISLLSKWGQLQEADRSLVLSRHRVSFLDRSEGRHKGKKERKGGDASLERSTSRGYTDADTSRASGGSSRAIETRISLTLRGRGWRGAEGWWPPFFTSSSILVPCKYCNFFLPFVTRLFSIRRARKRKVVELG